MKKYSISLIALLLYSICTIAETKFLYYNGNDEITRYRVIIGERSYWAGAGSSLHMETGLLLGNAILCEPALGHYNGIIRIPETIDFDGDDYEWEGHGTWHFEPKVLKVTGCKVGVFENCSALKKVIFPDSYEQDLDIFGFPTKFNSLGVSFKGCTSLLAVENMNLSWVLERQFEGCSSLKKMDLSKTTYIEESAFSGCSSLEELTFKSDVKISDYAFSDCNAIKKLVVQSKQSPEPFNDNVFSQIVYEQAILIVPIGKVNRYKQTNGWKNFLKIYEEGSEPSTDPTIEPTDSVTLIANSFSRQYGEDNPVFEYTVLSGKVESGTPTITCTATKTSPVGTYDIIIECGSVSNKHVTLVNGKLTITKAPLTISIGDYSKVEGESNPLFTPSFSGFKNGETKSVLTKQPAISCSATTSSGPGTYPITISSAEAQNYEMSYKNGTLTVIAKQTPSEENAKPYVVYNNGTLTFYCDNQRSSRQGTTYELDQKCDINEFTKDVPAWLENRESITKAVFNASFASAKPKTTARWFSGCSAMTDIEGIAFLNTSNVTNMYDMFGDCYGLTCLDVSHFDTSNVTDMRCMFTFCNGLMSLDLSNFNTGNVTDMGWMFVGCSGLTSLNLSNFNTRNVTRMDDMFDMCSGLTSLDVSNFNTSNVIDMTYMFTSCSGLTNLNLSNFDTRKVKSLAGMFIGCYNLSKLTLGDHFVTTDEQYGEVALASSYKLKTVTFTGDIPYSIKSEFFEGVGTANAPVTLEVPDQYRDHYVAKLVDNKFFGGYFTLSGSSAQKDGDLNGDGEVNGTDLVLLVNYILQGNYNEAADLNGDGQVNGTDLVALVNIIMNNGSANARKAMTRSNDISNTRVSIEPLYIGTGESCEMTISLSNPNLDVTMMQLDMVLPKGLRINRTGNYMEYELTDRTSNNKHSAYIRDNGDFTRVLIASGTNAILDGNEGGVIRLTLTADDDFEGGNIKFKNMLCTSPDLQEARPQSFTAYISGNTTSIHEIGTEDKGGSIYNLSGQRLKTMHKGLNILNGKKIVVK